MADSKISALTAATTLAGTDELVLNNAGTSKKITGANLKASIAPKVYLSKPAGSITRASSTVGSFSTAWQITGVVVASGQNVRLTLSASSSNGAVTQDYILGFARGASFIASRIFNSPSASPFSSHDLEWIDENPGAGTYTYEVQAATFAGATLTVFQSTVTTDTGGGNSIFIAEVYTP